MRVLVCGSRTFSDRSVVDNMLYGYYTSEPDDEFLIIEGQCPYGGADAFAEEWASRMGADHLPFVPEMKDGHVLGPKRNQQMLDEGKPDIVLAFVDKPLASSRGTADMVRRARAADIPTYVIEVLQ